MTGEKNKYQTHEKLWKLEDGELSTPQHDELILNLLSRDYADVMVELLGLDATLNPKYEGGLKKCNQLLSTEILTELCKKSSNDIMMNDRLKLKVSSEVPIKAKSGFLIGYLDIQIQIPCFLKYVIDISSECFNHCNFDTAFAGTDCPQSEDYWKHVGYLFWTNAKFKQMNLNSGGIIQTVWNINVEAKPKIKSFGETLRQINTYRSYTDNSTYVIYSPDTRFKAAFESQGIKFITPSDLGIN